jgi:hypothetical protein
MTAHTPGPWTVELDTIEDGDIAVFADGLLAVAAVDCRDDSDDAESIPRETALANAHVIAVAPDMLAMLKRISERYLLPTGMGGPGPEIAALIAKAEPR